ncbi:MAG: Smr/MutS family protein [Spirochaetota bacterium]
MSGKDFGRILDEWEQKKKREPTDRAQREHAAFRDALDNYLPDPEDRSPAEHSGAERDTDAFAALPSEARLDLHGMSVDEARRRVRAFLRDSHANGYRKVTIIHGKGNHNIDRVSRLKKAVFRELEANAIAGKTMQPPRVHGGSGAVWVRIRNYRSR